MISNWLQRIGAWIVPPLTAPPDGEQPVTDLPGLACPGEQPTTPPQPRGGGLQFRIDPFPTPWDARFRDLRTVTVTMSGATDDDIEFNSGLIELHGLLAELEDELWFAEPPRPAPEFPRHLSLEVEAIQEYLDQLGRLAATSSPHHPVYFPPYPRMANQ